MNKPEILSAEKANKLVEKNITGKKNQEFVKGIIDAYEIWHNAQVKQLFEEIEEKYLKCSTNLCMTIMIPYKAWQQLKQKGG